MFLCTKQLEPWNVAISLVKLIIILVNTFFNENCITAERANDFMQIVKG